MNAAPRLEIPHNILVIDTALYERQLYSAGFRGEMRETSGNPRVQGSALSLMNLTQSLGVNAQGILHNAGNDAMLCMLNLQLLLDPENTKIPNLRGSNVQQALMRNAARGPVGMGGMPGIALAPPVMPIYGMMPMGSPVLYPQLAPDDGASSRRGSPSQPSPSGRPRKPSTLSLADGRGSMSRRGSAGTNGIDEAAEKMNALRMG